MPYARADASVDLAGKVFALRVCAKESVRDCPFDVFVFAHFAGTLFIEFSNRFLSSNLTFVAFCIVVWEIDYFATVTLPCF